MAPVRSGEAATWCAVTTLVDVARIVEPGVQVCTWRRAARDDVPRIAATGDARAFPMTLEVLDAGSAPALASLNHLDEHAAIVDDVTRLGRVLCDLVGCPLVGVRVAGLTGAMCPGWHVDRVALRLTCTYRGPGTQWLADQSADRASLGVPDACSRQHVSAAPGEVVLLKGVGWPGNEQLGAVHRSPAVPAGADARILATIDPLWPA